MLAFGYQHVVGVQKTYQIVPRYLLFHLQNLLNIWTLHNVLPLVLWRSFWEPKWDPKTVAHGEHSAKNSVWLPPTCSSQLFPPLDCLPALILGSQILSGASKWGPEPSSMAVYGVNDLVLLQLTTSSRRDWFPDTNEAFQNLLGRSWCLMGSGCQYVSGFSKNGERSRNSSNVQ